MSENLQLYRVDNKEKNNQLVLNESPDALIQEKYQSLVASRVSDLQSLLPIQKNSTEGKKGYESKTNYEWLRYAIQPFDATPEYKEWKSTFDQLKQGFITTKKDLLDKESILFANKAELAAIDVKLIFIEKRRAELSAVSSGEKEKELNGLKEMEVRLNSVKDTKTNTYDIGEQEKSISELKQKLVSGDGIGYEKIITHINTKPALVKKHYESQQTNIQSTMGDWNTKNLADVNNPSYKELYDRVSILQESIGKHNETIASKKTETQSSSRRIHQENVSIISAITNKFTAFADYLNTNLLIKGYGGLDKESDRAKASLQYHIYDLMLGDLGVEPLDFVDQFYQQERPSHLSDKVTGLMDVAGVIYLDKSDSDSKGLEGVKVTTNSGALWKAELYDNMRDFYDSTYNNNIDSDGWSKDPIGLQSEIGAVEFNNTTYKSYKKDNDIIGGIINNIKVTVDIAKIYKDYAYEIAAFESKSIQRQYLEDVYRFISPQYNSANSEFAKADKAIEKLQGTKLPNLEKQIQQLNSEYPVIVALIKNGKAPSSAEEFKDLRAYKDRLRSIEQQGSVLGELRILQQVKDESFELAKNLKPIADAYSTAFNTYRQPEQPVWSQTYTNTEYPLQVGIIGVFPTSDSIDFASVLDYVTTDTIPDKNKE